MKVSWITPAIVLAAGWLGGCSMDRPGKPSSEPTVHTGSAARSVRAPLQQPSATPTRAVHWGITMPPGTQRVHSQDKPGFHGEPVAAVWLASKASVADAGAHFAGHAGAEKPYALSGYASCVDITNTRVCVSAADTIPRTMGAPTRPIAQSPPSGTRSWITLYRQGKPPPCPPCTPGTRGTTKPGCSCP
jgi:hypothetical protein